jgi:hypothetical protein
MFQRPQRTDRRTDNSAIDNNNNQTVGSMRLSGAGERGESRNAVGNEDAGGEAEAVWRRNGGEWRGQMRCGPFVLCGLEGAGREQKEHTVRAGAIHAKIVVEPRAKDAVEAQIGRIRDREMRCGRWRMENGE